MMLKKCKLAHTDRDFGSSERYTCLKTQPTDLSYFQNYLTRNSRLQKPFGG